MQTAAATLDILAFVATNMYGLWVIFPLVALRNVLDGRGTLRARLRRVPLNLLVFWACFALCRLLVFFRPMPSIFQVIPEPTSTYLFFASGAVCCLLWWAVDVQKRMASRSTPTSLSPAGSFNLPKAASQDAVPLCPKCGVPMVLHTARRGKRLRQKFYGCPNYPACREILPL